MGQDSVGDRSRFALPGNATKQQTVGYLNDSSIRPESGFESIFSRAQICRSRVPTAATICSSCSSPKPNRSSSHLFDSDFPKATRGKISILAVRLKPCYWKRLHPALLSAEQINYATKPFGSSHTGPAGRQAIIRVQGGLPYRRPPSRCGWSPRKRCGCI
jgi:hypothetical protein